MQVLSVKLEAAEKENCLVLLEEAPKKEFEPEILLEWKEKAERGAELKNLEVAFDGGGDDFWFNGSSISMDAFFISSL